MFKVKHKNTRTTSVSIVDFEQVNVSWVTKTFNSSSKIISNSK